VPRMVRRPRLPGVVVLVGRRGPGRGPEFPTAEAGLPGVQQSRLVRPFRLCAYRRRRARVRWFRVRWVVWVRMCRCG